MTRIVLINRQEVAELLPMTECINLMRDAFLAATDGTASQELRTIIPLSGNNCMGLMPGSLKRPNCFGVKVASVFPGNFGTDLQTHQGMIILFEGQQGRPLAAVHAGEVTAIRTAAASAVATNILAREDASTIAILGYGEQAEKHIEAMLLVRPIQRVRVWGRHFEKAINFAACMQERHGLPCIACPDIDTAVARADIICTVTAARDPFLEARHLEPGVHLNVVGSSTAAFREVTNEVVAMTRFFVDHAAMTRTAGGEFIAALNAGVIDSAHIVAEVGEVLAGTHSGRRGIKEMTMFKSLGMPAEDLLSAHHVYRATLKRASEFPSIDW